MKITISGDIGSGKSTVAKILAKKLNLKHYSTGDLMRQLAKESKKDMLEFSRSAETNPEIDKLLDNRQELLGKTDDNFVIDGRLSWYFIPDSFKVFLKVDKKEAAKRIIKDKRSGERYNKDIGSALEGIDRRRNSEHKRYKILYDVDYGDESNYDLIIDTTSIPAEEVAHRIIKSLKL